MIIKSIWLATLLLFSATGFCGSYRIDDTNHSIYLTSSINSMDEYIGLIQYINSHKEVKDMNVYLAGNGGSVAAMKALILTMKMSPTKFHAIVYSNVYSAHAFLAISMDTLEASDDSVLFLFHRPAMGTELMPDYCKNIDKEEKDRGVSARDKCLRFVTAIEKSLNLIMMNRLTHVLTGEELTRYLQGDDVVITYKELKHNQGV